MELSIIIVNWNTCQPLLTCLASIFANPPRGSFEVLVFDNASEDGSSDAVASAFPQVRLFANQENLGFARANNRAAAVACGQHWLLLNPDTAVYPNTLDTLLAHLGNQPAVGAVGPRLLYPDGTLQTSVERLPTLFSEWWRLFHLDRLYPVSQYTNTTLRSKGAQPVEVLNGACLMLRRSAVQPLGLFDEEYFVYSEEIDLCDRLRQSGWALHWVPEARVTHYGGQSTKQAADRMFVELYRNKLKFFRKRRGALSAALYKLVLLEAALVRYSAYQAARALHLPQRRQWANAARQYRLLLAALPKL